ncbi:unnamed protein product, partial [Polarella glacialis]
MSKHWAQQAAVPMMRALAAQRLLECGTRTEQGSRRARPGLDSDQAACLHRIPRCSFGTRKLKQSSLEALAAMLRSGAGTWTTASKAIFPLVNGKSCLEWKNGCTSLFALSSKTYLNMICSKISSPAAHQDCVGSDSTTAQVHCSTSVQLVSRTNVGRRLAREASSRWHATETPVHLPGACNVHTVLNNLVTFPVGTNDTEADQRGHVRACLAPLASGS